MHRLLLYTILVLCCAPLLSACYTTRPSTLPVELEAKTGTPSAQSLECPQFTTAEPVARAKRNEAVQLSSAALDAAQSGLFEDARTHLSRAVELDPTNPNAAFNLGVVFERLGEDVRAVEEFCRYLALAPDAEDAGEVRARAASLVESGPDVSEEALSHFRVAYGFAQQGDFKLALKSSHRAIDEAPNWADAYFNRALAYDGLQKPRRARRDFERYLEMNPNAPDAMLVRDKINALKMRKEFSLAKTVWRVVGVPGIILTGALGAVLIVSVLDGPGGV